MQKSANQTLLCINGLRLIVKNDRALTPFIFQNLSKDPVDITDDAKKKIV